MNIEITKEELKDIVSKFWCTNFPETFFLNNKESSSETAFFIVKQSIIKKDFIVDVIVNSKEFENLINKKIRNLFNTTSRFYHLDNDEIISVGRKSVRELSNFDSLRKEILKSSKINKLEYDKKEAKKKIRQAKKTLRLAGEL